MKQAQIANGIKNYIADNTDLTVFMVKSGSNMFNFTKNREEIRLERKTVIVHVIHTYLPYFPMFVLILTFCTQCRAKS